MNDIGRKPIEAKMNIYVRDLICPIFCNITKQNGRKKEINNHFDLEVHLEGM